MITIQKSVVQNLLNQVSPTVQDGEIYALPVLATQLTWQTIFIGTPGAISVQILVSSDGINFNVLDSSAILAGESRTNITSSNFIKAKIASITPGSCTGVTVSVVAEPGGGTITNTTGTGTGPQGPAGPQGIQGVPGPAPAGTGYAHVTGGILDQPAQLWVDLGEGIFPNPPVNVERMYALEVNGYTQVELVDSAGHGARVASDNIVIVKITQSTGVVRGQPVFIAGAAGANPLVQLAKADNIATMPCIGIVLDSGALNAFTRVLTSGTLQGIDTSAFIEGASLFVSPTVAGGFTTTLPIAPAYAQRVGFVTRSHLTQGEILVLTTGVISDPRLHAATHYLGGTDPVDIKLLAGYTGGVVNFLRADGTFAAPTVGVPGAHHTTHEPGGSDYLVNSVWLNLQNVFTARQFIDALNSALVLTDSSQPATARRVELVATGGTLRLQLVDDPVTVGQNVLIMSRDGTTSLSGKLHVQGGDLYLETAGAIHWSRTGLPVDTNKWLEVGAYPGDGSFRIYPVNDADNVAQNLGLILERSGNLIIHGDQYITKTSPVLALNDTSRPADLRLFRVFQTGQVFYITATNDAQTVNTGYVNMDRAGVFNAPAGLGGTPLNASQLTTGSVPDARLNPNIARTDIDNHMVAQTFPNIEINQNALLALTDPASAANAKKWRFVGYGDSQLRLERLTDAGAIIDWSMIFDRSGNASVRNDFSFSGTLVGGTVPDARLSANVALKNINNNFTANQTINGAGLADLSLIDTASGITARLICYQNLFQVFSNNLGAGIIKANPIDGTVAVYTGLYERQRTTMMGDWINFTPVISSDSGAVTLNQVATARYTLIGHTMTINLHINLIVSANTYTIYVNIPNNLVCNSIVANPVYVNPGATGDSFTDCIFVANTGDGRITINLTPIQLFIITNHWIGGMITFSIT